MCLVKGLQNGEIQQFSKFITNFIDGFGITSLKVMMVNNN